MPGKRRLFVLAAVLVLGLVVGYREARAEFRLGSLVHYTSYGPVSLAPYLDRSRIYLEGPKSLVESVLGQTFFIEKLIDSNERAMVIRLKKAIPSPEAYLELVNKLNKNPGLEFASPVFDFSRQTLLPIRTLATIKPMVTVSFKATFRDTLLEDFKSRLNLTDNNLAYSQGILTISLPKGSPLNPFEMASNLSPYFDPRVVSSSLLWVRLEPAGYASVRVYPRGSPKSNTGLHLIEQAIFEFTIVLLPDSIIEPKEMSPQTSIMRQWQPISGPRPNLELFDEELLIAERPQAKGHEWRIWMRGRFTQPGSFIFPSLKIPVRTRSIDGTLTSENILTNEINVNVVKLNPADVSDIVPLSSFQSPGARQTWRLIFIGAGSLAFLISAILLFIAWLRSRREVNQDQYTVAALSLLLDRKLEPMSQLCAKGLNERTEWLSLAHDLLADFDKTIHEWFGQGNGRTSILNDARLLLEKIEFGEVWNDETQNQIIQLLQGLASKVLEQFEELKAEREG